VGALERVVDKTKKDLLGERVTLSFHERMELALTPVIRSDVGCVC